MMLNQRKNKDYKKLLGRVKRRILKHVWLVRIFVVVSVLFLLIFSIRMFVYIAHRCGVDQYLSVMGDFIRAPSDKIDYSHGRINLLVLGKGGLGHEAPDLTDTIMIVSVPMEKEKVKVISVPRDIWIKEIRAKINSSYYWGNQKQEKGGLVLARSTVERVIGEKIHYVVVVDFDLFVTLIDLLDGVEVNVENSFIDNKYPIKGMENASCGVPGNFDCRYETVVFEKGSQVMDGERALKYVRSRNADGDEGTDLARAARQEIVIRAVITKALSKEILMSSSIRNKMRGIFQNAVETDTTLSSQAIILRKMFDSRSNIQSTTIPEDLLYVPKKSAEYDNLYVFMPKTEEFLEIHEWADGYLYSH